MGFDIFCRKLQKVSGWSCCSLEALEQRADVSPNILTDPDMHDVAVRTSLARDKLAELSLASLRRRLAPLPASSESSAIARVQPCKLRSRAVMCCFRSLFKSLQVAPLLPSFVSPNRHGVALRYQECILQTYIHIHIYIYTYTYICRPRMLQLDRASGHVTTKVAATSAR